jgi:hypothetical protein
MTDLFSAYAKAAHSRVNSPARLVGVIKTRAEARERYVEIVADMTACETPAELAAYLDSVNAEIVQFQAEMEFLWAGENDFLGLQKEIERAHARVDDGLDYPRWEPERFENQGAEQ